MEAVGKLTNALTDNLNARYCESKWQIETIICVKLTLGFLLS